MFDRFPLNTYFILLLCFPNMFAKGKERSVAIQDIFKSGPATPSDVSGSQPLSSVASLGAPKRGGATLV